MSSHMRFLFIVKRAVLNTEKWYTLDGMEENHGNRNSPAFSKAIKLFFILFLLFSSVLGAVVAVFYKLQFDSILTGIKRQEIHTVTIQKNGIGNDLDDIISDILVLSRQNSLQRYLDTGNQKIRKSIEYEYKKLAIYKKKYDQIRYIDALGQEVIRINYHAESPCVVSRKDLQNKYRRYYFQDTFRLGQGEVFVSPLDLNIEKGRIEQPLKPVIRFGTPVFNSKKQKCGIVLLNYMGQYLLDAIFRSSNPFMGSPMLLNNKGYWLLSHNPENEWGFMIPGRKEKNFSRFYPGEWKTMLQKKTGQMYTTKGLFTFTTIYPLQKGITSSTGSSKAYIPDTSEIGADQYFWILVTHVSPAVLKEYTAPLRFRVFFLCAGLLVFAALGAWFMAFTVIKRRMYQRHLLIMALHDPLTSLPNRKLFLNGLEQLWDTHSAIKVNLEFYTLTLTGSRP